MLDCYGRQLSSARRLARFRRALRLARAEDEVSISRQARRRVLVERIAKEIIENLVVNETGNPMVEEILKSLERELGQRLLFEYPLDGGDVLLIEETQAGPKRIGPEEKEHVMRRLWEITLNKVDETML
ncbi:MAG: hypothetical protein JW718_00385 [Desulfovibrionaceae bacterium]|nr:hypothetical protein [Desulfovibrionaceae bacterium]